MIDLSVCIDCMMLIANGEGTDEHADRVAGQWPDHYLGCGNSDEDGTACAFASRRCEGCGSDLGGSRYAAHAWPRVPVSGR